MIQTMQAPRTVPDLDPACGSYSRKSQWFVFQTHPRREPEVEQTLKKMGFRVFMPRMNDKSVSILKTRGLLLAGRTMLFPGYGFVRFDVFRDPWKLIRWQPGVRRLFISLAQDPIAVPARIMRGLINSCLLRRLGNEVRPEIKPGAVIRICSGLYRGETFIVSKLKSSKRVAVLMEILGGQRDVDFDISNLALVS